MRRGRSRRLACVDPHPRSSTVERMATPVTLPTWRMVLKKVDPRPIDFRRDPGEGGRLVWAP